MFAKRYQPLHGGEIWVAIRDYYNSNIKGKVSHGTKCEAQGVGTLSTVWGCSDCTFHI